MEGEDEASLSESCKRLQQSSDHASSNVNVTSCIPPHRPARQLWLHAALMCGRDFLYAIEVALVTPIMLQLGMPEYLYSYIWFISPTFGLLLGPLMGNWSDRCTLRWGRRRPFILSFVLGTLVGLTLMILSKDLASLLSSIPSKQRTIGLVFGIAGTQVMDFCLDQLETPLRAYTFDVCSPSDQKRAFTLQSFAMGTGAGLGYIIDGIKWNQIFGVEGEGVQIKVVYAFAMIIYVSMAVMTLASVKEIQWKKPKKIQAKVQVKDNWANERNNTMHRVKTREAASEPTIPNVECVNPQKNGMNNLQVPRITVESDTSKVQLDTYVTNATETCSSAAVRSITVLPRISLCKSVFLTMSCPEGLNDASTSESNTTTISLAMENDESSSDESAIKEDDQDGHFCGKSLPDLSDTSPLQTKPSTIFELLKNTLSSSTGNMSQEKTAKDEKLESSISMHSGSLNTSEKNVEKIHTNSNGRTNEKAIFSPKTTKKKQIHLQMDGFSSENNIFESKSKETRITEGNHHHDDQNIINNNDVVRKIEFEDEPILKTKVNVAEHTKKKKKTEKTKKLGYDEDLKPVSTRSLWISIVTMPTKLRFLCLSLLISFTGIEIEMLWYTNIFGSVVYGGDPTAPPNSTELQLYNDGVHVACWGLTMYAAAVMLFSVAMEHLDILSKVSLRTLYSGSQLLTAISTMIMFLSPQEAVILSLTWTIGVTVSTSLVIPYVLVGKYHQDKEFVLKSPGATKRGYGTDCAILACQMYAGNLMYALVSGPIIQAYGGVRIVLVAASVSHLMAFILCVRFVTYPDEKSLEICDWKRRTNVENSD